MIQSIPDDSIHLIEVSIPFIIHTCDHTDGHRPDNRLDNILYSNIVYNSDDDQIVFNEMKNGVITNKESSDIDDNTHIDATDVQNGFSTLKNQIHDLKQHIRQLKDDNSKKNSIINKHRLVKNTDSEYGRGNSSGKKRSSNVYQDSKKRSISNTKRYNSSQNNPFRSTIFGRSMLNGSTEGSKQSSSDKLIMNDKDDSKRNNISYKSKKYISKIPMNNPLKKDKDIYTNKIRSSDILSIVNNNVYSSIKPISSRLDNLQSKIKNKFTSPNKSQEKEIKNKIEEFRSSLTCTRLRSKKNVRQAKDVSKEASKDSILRDRNDLTAIRKKKCDNNAFSHKYERQNNPRNPLILSLKKWDIKSEKNKDNSIYTSHIDNIIDSIRDTKHLEAIKQIMTKSSTFNGSYKESQDTIYNKILSNTKCSTPAGRSIPKTNNSDIAEEMKPNFTDKDKQKIINYLSRNQEDLEFNYNVLMEWDKKKSNEKGRKHINLLKTMNNK